jgi:uncharacterized protein YegL
MEVKGIELQARSLPVFVLADTSGSMQGDKVNSLNQALATLIQDMRNDDQTKESVRLGVITFGSRVDEAVKLESISKVQVPQFSANGNTPMGEAFRRVLAILTDERRVPKDNLTPVIALLTDGQPTDEWRHPLNELMKHRRGGTALRLALAIGGDADVKMLEQFVSEEYPVLRADQAEKIKTFFKFVTWVSKQVYQSGGQNRSGQQVPKDLLP